ncbi:MAG: T9SS type A sorting domain-containing protein, partial [Bacteroidales bacterium]|nr:T9SS type A sorting domain-containing protein [Bacteroidales bacterium]
VLCTGNTIELDGGDFIDYKWYKDGMPYAVTRYLTVGETGTYLLEAKTDLGCMASDTFRLKVSDNPLDATIILPDSAVVNDTVRVLDVTWPVPDSIQWFYSLPVEVIDSNYWSEKFTAEESGLMHVTLRAWYGGCFSDSSKTIYIYEDENHIFKSADGSQPLISEYIVYPNPNDGRFVLDVLLSREADIRLTLIQPNTGSKIAEKMDYGLSKYSIPYDLTGLRAGVYLIIISAENEQVTLKISIAN